MHILNHVLTSRTRVQRHNRRIKELTNNDDSDENSSGKEQLPDDEEGGDKWRDQGYTRPKVLVLFPTRGTCWKFVQQMMKLLGDSAIVEKSERFDEEFGPSELGGGDGSDDEDDAGAEARRAAVLKQKGAEWNELFGDEINNDDLQDSIQTKRQADKINAYQEFHNPTKPLEVDEPLSSSSLSHSQSPTKSSETTIERTTQASNESSHTDDSPKQVAFEEPVKVPTSPTKKIAASSPSPVKRNTGSFQEYMKAVHLKDQLLRLKDLRILMTRKV